MNYYLSANDQVTGPYNREELIDSMKYGVVPEDAQICPEGSDKWIPITILTHGEPSAPQKKAAAQKAQQAKSEIALGGTPTPSANSAQQPLTPFSDIQQANANPETVFDEHYRGKSTSTAVLLEVILGIFQVFGVGNIYAGNVVTGIILMLSYWALLAVNIALLFVLVGFVTLPLTFIVYLAIAIITAQKAADRANWEMIMKGDRKA